MTTENRMGWERLSIELELLASEDSASLIQLLIGLNGWICPEDSMEWTTRSMNFMTYDLMAQSEGLGEIDRYRLLNEYYFERKGFQILQMRPQESQERHLLLHPVLENRSGMPIIIALIYLHFAAHLDLPIHLIHLRNHYLLKWIRGDHACYIDLCSEGRLVSEEELMNIVTKSTDTPSAPQTLSVLSNRKTFLRYLEDLVKIYERLESPQRLHAAFNVILKVEPQNSRVIGRRALLRHKLGQDKDALADLKRYFSFVDRAQAPVEMLAAFQELTARPEILRTLH